MDGETETRGRHNAAATFRHDAQLIRGRPAAVADHVVGRREDLQGAGDIEHLHRRIGQHLDRARAARPKSWRVWWGIWHSRQKVTHYLPSVHPRRTRPMIAPDRHLAIGSLVFEGVDQIDLTGPFEVLSRIPNSTYRLYGKTARPVRDIKGLRLIPDADLGEAPALDVLHVPGGFGQEALMEDEA